jgi:hypothetical protein
MIYLFQTSTSLISKRIPKLKVLVLKIALTERVHLFLIS